MPARSGKLAAECIASASATPSPRQYKTENVDNSLIAVGT